MASWFEDWETFCDAIARETEEFCEGMAIAFHKFCGPIVRDLEHNWEKVQQGTELQEVWAGIVETFCSEDAEEEEMEEDLSSEPSEVPTPLPFFEEPSEADNPACRGCRNYHGYIYNGVQLVCTMHPAGWDGDRCPDWETTDRHFYSQ